jgi:hypothetical protein
VTTEATILGRIRRALGTLPHVRLFRNDCGVAWAGQLIERRGTTVTLRRAQRITYGLQPGSSDLVGWQSVEITPEMVGRRVAVFTSIEVKTERGRVSQPQQRWLYALHKAGGNVGVARSVEEAETLLDTYEPTE